MIRRVCPDLQSLVGMFDPQGVDHVLCNFTDCGYCTGHRRSRMASSGLPEPTVRREDSLLDPADPPFDHVGKDPDWAGGR